MLHIKEIANHPVHACGGLLDKGKVFEHPTRIGRIVRQPSPHQTRTDRNRDDGIFQVVTDNRQKLIPGNQLRIDVDSFIEQIAVRLFPLLFKERFSNQLFFDALLVLNPIDLFPFNRLEFVCPFPFLT